MLFGQIFARLTEKWSNEEKNIRSVQKLLGAWESKHIFDSEHIEKWSAKLHAVQNRSAGCLSCVSNDTERSTVLNGGESAPVPGLSVGRVGIADLSPVCLQPEQQQSYCLQPLLRGAIFNPETVNTACSFMMALFRALRAQYLAHHRSDPVGQATTHELVSTVMVCSFRLLHLYALAQQQQGEQGEQEHGGSDAMYSGDWDVWTVAMASVFLSGKVSSA